MCEVVAVNDERPRRHFNVVAGIQRCLDGSRKAQWTGDVVKSLHS